MENTPDPGTPATSGIHKQNVGQPIVGLGASAGGLAPIEEFISAVSPQSGIAYIVVQHLNPTQPDLLPELLQRVTTLPVLTAKQDMPIEPNHVYVIPPNADLSVVNNSIHLAIPGEARGRRQPIDVLFSSLAGRPNELGIGVILSGMGSDGTLGAKALNTTGGLIVVQDPESAQFDSMPKSAIAAGCADIITLPADMPERIAAFIGNIRQGDSANQVSPEEEAVGPFQQIVEILHRQTRHDLSLYKSSTLRRRIERRMAIHGIVTISNYVDILKHNTQEVDLLFKEVLVGVTSFFRDPEVWEYLETTALAELLQRRSSGSALRAWCAGCSTGEEAYSLAMIFIEVTERLNLPQQFTLQIFASDLNPEAIALARSGMYPLSIRDTVSPERLERFFSTHENYYQIKQSIRDMVLFARHDVVLDPPFTRQDLIICRNLLIYFEAILQRRLLPLFHYSLRPNGVLLLGSSETIGRFDNLFMPLQSKLRFYLRQDQAKLSHVLPVQSFPPLSKIAMEQTVPSTIKPSDTTNNLQSAADNVLLQVYAPAAVVINKDGDIVYISGRTGKYLEPAAGKANWNFHAMAREGLRYPITEAIKEISTQDNQKSLRGLQVAVPGGVQLVDVMVQRLDKPAVLQGMTMIVFHDISTTKTGRGRRKGKDEVEASHAAEIQQYQDEIQALREEARASHEELQASNEELQSTNEELQSANEELTTSKEEMQSMYEELQTINSELQSKLDDLALAQSDLQNTLNSIEIALLFLDQNLNVRRFTERTAKIFNLRESDVGRPLSDLTNSLQYPDLKSDVEHSLRSLITSEKDVPTTDGGWYHIRIMPYRRLDNMIDGVVITLVDISAAKELEASLRK